LLNLREVEYLLIGGYAVSYYGYPRATGDMDVWIAIAPENATKIVEVLKEFGFNVPNLSVDLFLQENKIIRMGIPPLRLEILTTISGVKFTECFQEKLVAEIDGIKVNLISLKHLKLNKKASGRFKDLNDLENLS
jgi:hypothetical protein